MKGVERERKKKKNEGKRHTEGVPVTSKKERIRNEKEKREGREGEERRKKSYTHLLYVRESIELMYIRRLERGRQ